MKKGFKILDLAFIAAWMITFTGCKKVEPAKLAFVSTTPVTNITTTTAVSGGIISSDGGAPITVIGVCWSKASNPTIELSTKSDRTPIYGTEIGSGPFISEIDGLLSFTTYYLRAYVEKPVPLTIISRTKLTISN